MEQEIILLNLQLGKPGITKALTKDELEMVRSGAKEAKIRMTKPLFDPKPDYETVAQYDVQIESELKKLVLPASKIMRAGIHRCPGALAQNVDRMLSERWYRRNELIQVFLDNRWNAVDRCQDWLRGQGLGFLISDSYSNDAEVRKAFVMAWSFFTPGVSDSFGDSLIAEKQRGELARMQQESLEECRQALRVAWSELVERAADRLRVDAQGKKMIFRDSLVEDLQSFIATFASRNIAGDGVLEKMVEQAREIMRLVPDAESLRKDLDVREKARQTFASIESRFDEQMPEVSRKFRLAVGSTLEQAAA